jgi:hypothetical protein
MWMNFWSTAVYDLELSSDEFYDLTPRQFDALLKRHKSRTEQNEFMFGQLTSWIANTGFRTTKEPTTPFDFMLSKQRQKAAAPPPKRVRMTAKRRNNLGLALRATLAQVATVKHV